jgi:hypothetical protein
MKSLCSPICFNNGNAQTTSGIVNWRWTSFLDLDQLQKKDQVVQESR